MDEGHAGLLLRRAERRCAIHPRHHDIRMKRRQFRKIRPVLKSKRPQGAATGPKPSERKRERRIFALLQRFFVCIRLDAGPRPVARKKLSAAMLSSRYCCTIRILYPFLYHTNLFRLLSFPLVLLPRWNQKGQSAPYDDIVSSLLPLRKK